MTSPHHTDDLAAPAAAEAPRTTTGPRRDTRSSWGRSARLGGGTGRLMGVSLAVGVVGAVGLGAAAWAATISAGHEDFLAWLAAGAMALNGLVFGFIVAWFMLVDRTSIRGAATNPEESIEGRWYDKATSGTFHDTLILVGLGSAVLSFGGYTVSPALVGAALFLFMAASAAVRYLLLKRRG